MSNRLDPPLAAFSATALSASGEPARRYAVAPMVVESRLHAYGMKTVEVTKLSQVDYIDLQKVLPPIIPRAIPLSVRSEGGGRHFMPGGLLPHQRRPMFTEIALAFRILFL
jgi:hypothetical protein